jgi:hypothetical protein
VSAYGSCGPGNRLNQDSHELIICVYPGNRLNQDSNYKKSICEVIDFKHRRGSELVREANLYLKVGLIVKANLQDPLTMGLHVAASEGLTKTVAALLSSFGADADATDEVLGIMLSLSCARVLSLSSF